MWPSIWYFIHVVDASVCVLPVIDNRKEKSKFQAKLKTGREKSGENVPCAKYAHAGAKIAVQSWPHMAASDRVDTHCKR